MSGVPVPAGIDDESFRALAELLEARFGSIPIERVLVWHLDSVVAAALPELANAFGVNGPEFGAGPPRTFLRQAVALRRKRGTGGALRVVLAAIGHEDIELIERTSATFLYDGTWKYDGTITYGGDSHWARYIVRIDVAEMPSVVQLALLWDVVAKWKPKTRWPILILRKTPEDYEMWFRSRTDIIEPPRIDSVTPSTGPIAGGTAVVIDGARFTAAHTVRFGDVDVAFEVDDDGQITATAPPHAEGDVAITVIRANGRSTLEGAFTYESSGAVVPVLSSMNIDVADTAGGGKPLVLTGSGFTGALAVAHCTSLVVDSDTQITAVLGAHAAGPVDITVTTPGGASNALVLEYFDESVPATPTGDWADYGGSPWSNGGSLGADASGATPPAVGAALSGHATADFTHPQALQTAAFVDSYTPSTGFELVALVNLDALQAPGAVYDDPGIWSDPYQNIGVSTAGYNVAAYDAGWKNGAPIACTPGAWELLDVHHDGTTMAFSVDGGTESTFACGTNDRSPGTYPATIGQSVPSSTTSMNGRIARLITYPAPLDPAGRIKTKKYFDHKYDL